MKEEFIVESHDYILIDDWIEDVSSKIIFDFFVFLLMSYLLISIIVVNKCYTKST